jgi:hypothetical protein
VPEIEGRRTALVSVGRRGDQHIDHRHGAFMMPHSRAR